MTTIRILGPLHGRPLILQRRVTTTECPWLKEDLPLGTVVYFYDGETYGCLSSSGVPVTLKGETTFVEVPRSAIFSGKPKRWTGRVE